MTARRLPALALLSLAAAAAAEVPLGLARPSAGYVPFDQSSAPGQYGRFALAANPAIRGEQAVSVVTPSPARVSLFAGDGRAETLSTDDVFRLQVGRVYRLKVDAIDGLPGVELYPTVELVDRLHPPEGLEREFPVVIELTAGEIDAALTDRLVTKVVYVRPRHDVAVLRESQDLPTAALPPASNPVAEALLRGRPIAVVRIGGRTPLSPDDRAFFTGGPFTNLGPKSCVTPAGHVCGPSCPADCNALPTVTRVELPVVDGEVRPASTAELFPDEYICDGGDTGFPSRIGIDGKAELGFEETAGQFVTDTGYAGEAVVRLEPSTRTCVYAPAFAAVRVTSGLTTDSIVVSAAGAYDSSAAAGAESRLAIMTGRQTDVGAVARVRSRGSEVGRTQTDSNVSLSARAAESEKLINAFMEYGFLTDQELSRETIAVLQDRVRNAGEWSTEQSPTVTALDEGGRVYIASTAAQEYVVFEDRREEGSLQIVKTADVRAARPGERVTFRIRFENAGGRPVREVVISDHLSPRLRLEKASVKSTLPAAVAVEDDFAGSVYLRVTLEDELKPRSGGVITFETVVR